MAIGKAFGRPCRSGSANRGPSGMPVSQGFLLRNGPAAPNTEETEARRHGEILLGECFWRSLRTGETPDKRLTGKFCGCEAPPCKISVSPFSARAVFCAAGRGPKVTNGLAHCGEGAYPTGIRGRPIPARSVSGTASSAPEPDFPSPDPVPGEVTGRDRDCRGARRRGWRPDRVPERHRGTRENPRGGGGSRGGRSSRRRGGRCVRRRPRRECRR